jgi:hypothetical protein
MHGGVSKKIRAIIRLVRPVLDKEYRTVDRDLSTVSRLLAPVADGPRHRRNTRRKSSIGIPHRCPSGRSRLLAREFSATAPAPTMTRTRAESSRSPPARSAASAAA